MHLAVGLLLSTVSSRVIVFDIDTEILLLNVEDAAPQDLAEKVRDIYMLCPVDSPHFQP